MKRKATIKQFFAVIISIFVVLTCMLPLTAAADENESSSLTVGVPVDRCPVFYKDAETGEIVGIGADLMRVAANNAGYKDIEFIAIKESSLKEALDNDEYDVVMPFGSAISSTSGKAAVVSSNLFQTPFTLVTKDNRELPPFDSLRVGMLKSQGGVAETVKERYSGITINMYEDMSGCVKALRKNEVDALLHNSYVWSYVLQKPSYSDLTVQPSTMFSMDFRVATIDTPEGRKLINRLNSGISRISDTKCQAITLDYTSRKLYKYTFSDYLYSYWPIMLLAAFLIIAIIIITVQIIKNIRRKNDEKIRDMIDHDPLTGVLSMVGFRKRVEELLHANPNTPYILSYNNIRDFKFINERLGRDAGDKLLKFWTSKYAENLSDDEAIGRITADRFAVLSHIVSDKQTRFYEKNILEPVNNYFINQGKENSVQICSGIYVLTPQDFENIDVDRMLDMARVAEKRIRKSRDENAAFYNPEQWEKGKRIADIQNNLPNAMKYGDIKVWYQPQVNFETGEITGAEALCRWNHYNLGWLQPAEFIPILEDCGLIYELDKYVWEQVCKDLNKWNNMGQKQIVSVNVSRGDISESQNIAKYFDSLVKTYDLSPSQLRIEITESAYVENPKILIQTTEELKAYGFQVEMDDFGSGYSSLAMLKELPVERIKLDFRFLTSSGDPEKSQTIVSSMIQMVRKLEIDLIAEGVETEEQARFLQNEGACEMQGYYFYKPMATQDYEKIIGIEN
ncbi:MAG: EAL domain-containing protein [Eubacterium sp.]|nr:EAL domain-containing protein [Eubacterium sp.]MBR0412676.1 EAL domain-containing protein [Eubacterium sp.]